MKKQRIGIDARIFSGAGIARYIRNLILELERIDQINEYIIFLNSSDQHLYVPKNPNFKKWVVDVPIFSLSEQISLVLEYYRADLDILHIPNFNAPYLYQRKTILTIHDLTMLEADTDATKHDAWVYIIRSILANFLAKSVIRRAQSVICPTNAVKNQVISKFKVSKENIVVTYEGGDYDLVEKAAVSMDAVKRRVSMFNIDDGEEYLLYVGSFYPHKNLQSLLIAFKELKANSVFRGKLVLAGKIDIFAERLAAFVYGLKLEDHVIFAARYGENGKLSDEDIAFLYKGALAYVFPSKKEGFSITPLEAQSFNIPVVLSDIPVHQEVFGNSVLYFNPDSTSDIYENLKTVVQSISTRQSLVSSGKVNILKYSWENMAEKVLEIYNKIGE